MNSLINKQKKKETRRFFDIFRNLSTVLLSMLLGVVLLTEGLYGTPASNWTVEAAETKTVSVTVEVDYDYAYKVLELINKERTANSLGTLTMDKDLLAAAMQRAADNVVYVAVSGGSLSHDRPDGSDCFSLSEKSYGENIAAGQRSPSEVVSDWMNSTGHRQNILNAGYKSIGIGCVKVSTGYYYFWAQEFGYCTADTLQKPANKTAAFTVPVTDSYYSSLEKSTSAYMNYISLGYKGWKETDAGWVYYDSNGMVKDKWLTISNKKYYFQSDGIMATGWFLYQEKWYYLGKSGEARTGWVKYGTKWYYMDASGVMQTGWLKDGGKWYYLGTDGAMIYGWKNISGIWHYFSVNGVMKTGWLNYSGKWYYFTSSGAMVTGTRTIGQKEYRFSSSGVCQNP